MDGEVVRSQGDKPACLAAVKTRLLHEGAKVFVIRPNLDGMLTALQVVSPVLEGGDNSKHFLVWCRITQFGSLELSQEKGYWMLLVVFKKLGIYSSKSGIGGVGLNAAFQS